MKNWLISGAVALAVLALGLFTFLRSIGMYATRPVYAAGGATLGGTDVVAYFTDAGAIRGKAKFATQWNGAEWRFASQERRTRLLAALEHDVPQFGSYCAYAVSRDDIAKTDLAARTIVDGKLYLNFDLDTREKWLAERNCFIADGQRNGPKVLW